jgi:BirA family biotin operon repressor/biotin-[acetyl-CoA-carboxylase] ligase
MAFALSERARTAGYRLLSFDEIGSTNEEALARVRAGERGPLWIAAHRQTAGRGRRGRDWQTLDGNLAASVLQTLAIPAACAATLGFVAGLAAIEAVAVCAPGVQVSLKWPNDILAGNAKLAGILLESEQVTSGLAVAIGIGINVAHAPGGLPYPATSLAMLGRRVLPQDLFVALTEAWLGYSRLWDEGRGMASIRALWLGRAAGVGQAVSVQLGDKSLCGIFETIDDTGRLMLRGDDGSLVPISAGEVHIGIREPARAR